MNPERQFSLHLRTFSAPKLSSGAESTAPATLFPLGKPLALLTYLACAPARAATREQLIDLLWADTEREAARHTLRQTLWYIRRRLGVDPLTTRGDSISLTADCVSDRDTFLTALDAGDHLTAFETYTGDFFPGFAAPGGAEFEQWADVERTRLRALYVRAAESLIRARLDSWRARDAVPLARRARELAPHTQATWRLLLEALLAAEDRVSASVEAEQLEQWLARDEIPIEPATASLLRQVRREPSVPPTPAADDSIATELVGREREFSVLLAAWADARRGRSTHVHITARAGLGKTRLLDGLARRLRSTRARVVSIRAPQANRDIPFALAADLTLALARLRGAAGVSPDAASALVALAPGVSTYLSAQPDRATGDDALRRRSFALQELVTTIAEDAPIGLLLDDLHWADHSSRTLIASLAASLSSSSVLIVTASRHADVHASPSEHTKQLPLAPLTADEVGALLSSLGELPDSEHQPEAWSDTLVARLHAATGGSPLLVVETLQLALERGALSLHNRRWSCENQTLLASTLATGSAIRDRLLTVSDAHFATLLLLAVLGTELDDAAIERAVGADGTAALQELESRGLLAHTETGWSIAHDEIAALTCELASESRLARAHRQAATILESAEHATANVLVRAARHRHIAQDRREMQRLFARLVQATESRGNPIALRALASDIIGQDIDSAEREALVRSLPWKLRADVPRIFAAASVALAALLAVAVQVQARSTPAVLPDAVAWIPFISDTDTALLRVPVETSKWRNDRSVVAQKEAIAPRAIRALATMDAVFAKWGDTLVGGTLVYGKEAGFELVQLNLRSGETERLTDARGDDYSFTRSPDGRYAVFASARQDTVTQRSNLVLMDRRTREQVPLTRSIHWHSQPVWSPDGSRIAYISKFAEPKRSAICITTFDATHSECHVPDLEIELVRLLAWEDDYRLLTHIDARDSAQPGLAYIDVRNGLTRRISGYGSDRVGSPLNATRDARFILDQHSQAGSTELRAVDLDRSDLGVSATARLRDRDRRTSLGNVRRVVWEEPFTSPVALDGVRIVDAPSSVALNARILLRAAGTDGIGTARPVPYLTWHVVDTSVATITHDGELRPKRAGVATVIASAGGWRADTVSVEIADGTTHALDLREDWTRRDTGRWLEYGTPQPQRVRTSERGALHLDGDGHRHSGVLLRRAVDARAGMGIEVQVQLPLTGVQWQQFAVALTRVASDEELRTWTSRLMPEFPTHWLQDNWNRRCSIAAPRAEGGDAVDQIEFSVGGETEPIKRTEQTLTDGAWHTVRLQVFADGRCGIAFDGRVVAVSRRALPLDRPLRIELSGQSVGTRVLIGPLELWRGERYDLPWFAAERSDSVKPQ